MKRFHALFDLTVAEQRTIVVALLVLAAFFVTKTYREQRSEARTQQSTPAQPSPSPGARP